ncbi:MAG TPA: hypothetical protein ENH10_01515 [Bacteroidetes bacterium]|nr:hypothetical protein [Bacteroidota bacterium]HEX03824.1 hypothetical protein [Bacteroidota bacterium]
MTARSHARMCNSCRNAITLLLLGLIGIQFSAVTGISQLPASIPNLFLIVLQVLGWLNLILGFMLFVGGLQRREIIEWATGLDDMMTSGAFRYVRRPVYSGVLLMLFGVGLLMNSVGLLLTALLWSIAAVLYSRVDDRGIVKRMGASYQKYCRKTPLLVPHLGRIFSDLFRAE